MMDPLRREQFEAWVVIVTAYMVLLGCCGFVVWVFWR